MQRIAHVSVLLAMALLAACASHNVQTGVSGSSDAVVMNGCRVDPARICNRAHPDLNAAGGNWASDPLYENSGTTYYMVVVRRPNGDELFMVNCVVTTSTMSVTGAHVRPGAAITDDDAKYLRALNYCTEPASNS